MISNTMLLACLPFWDETCPIRAHEDCLFQAIVAAKKLVRRPTQEGLMDLAWDLDAAHFTDYNGPAECTCPNKDKLIHLITRIYHNAPVNIGAHHMWVLEDAWEAPYPQ